MSIIKHVTLRKIVAHDFRYDPRSIVDVPKCSNMWFVFLIHPNNINLTHSDKVSVSVSVSVRCLVLVKMYGNSPRKLFIRIISNSDVRMNEFPLFSFSFLRIVFISLCSFFLLKCLLLCCCVMGLVKILLGLVLIK